jgi:molecular chaperone DnaK (HSP70)
MRLGIDFGTCYSSAAVLIDGILHPVKEPLRPLESSFPSSVCVTKKGEIVISQAAENHRRLNPQGYKNHFKQDLGTDTPYFLGEQQLRFMPEDLVTLMLAGLKKEAEKIINTSLDSAVITIPATYLNNKKQLMEQAARAAGFTEVHLLEEPVAAAIYYSQQGKMGHQLNEGDILFVYDLGGGTFDAALIQKKGRGYELLSQPVGDRQCGGIYFDQLIAKDFIRQLNDSPVLELLNSHRKDTEALRAQLTLLDWCRNFKHQLSVSNEYEDLSPLSSDSYTLSRDKFEDMICPYIDSSCNFCERLLQQAGLQWENINRVLLVGGSCRIPYVQKRLEAQFKCSVVAIDDPELAICFGAAIYGAQQTGAQQTKEKKEKKPIQSTSKPSQLITDYGMKKSSMSHSKELNRFKEYGDNVLQKIQEYDVVIKEWSVQEDRVTEDLRRSIEEIKNAAQQVIDKASSPVRIGVMGEFKASKTTTLGSLLGYAGILPNSEVASTGNVTCLNIVQEEGLQTTQFQFSVKYLDRSGVVACLKFMLDKVKSKAEAAQLPQEQLARLQSLNAENSKVWESVVRWCREAKSPNKNPGFENAVKELEVFAESCKRYGEFIFGRSYSIDDDTARAGLQLPNDPFVALDQLNFDQIPPENEKLPEFLKATFPLIERIDAEVKVSKHIWDLSSLQGANKLVLLDFPGLGAEGSGIRDQFLSQREMENVKTILILTDGRQPGDANALQIFDMLQQQRQNQDLTDFILVAVGRFDQLHVTKQEQEKLDLLIAEKKQLTEQTVKSKLPALKKAIESALSYAEREDRIVLFSAYVALDDTRKRFSTVNVASQEILNELSDPDFQKKSNQTREKWKQLSQKLRECDSNSMLANWLEGFATDGGIRQLRRLLEKHVIDHGLNQVYQDARRAVEVLRQQQRWLQERLNSPEWKEELQATENSNLSVLSQSLRKLVKTYNDLTSYLQRASFELGVGIDKKRNGISLRQVVEEEATFQIFSWREWRDLFNNEKPSGKIECEKKHFPEKKRPFPQKNHPQRTFPTKTDDFYPIFQSTVENLEQSTQKGIRQALKEWLKELTEERITLQSGKITIDLGATLIGIRGIIEV